MADAAHDAIFVVDERAHILAANHQAFAMFGYSLSELLGLGIIQLIAPSDRARITRASPTIFCEQDLISNGRQQSASRSIRTATQFPLKFS